MGSAAAGERVRGLGQGPTPLSAGTNPKLSHYYMFPVLCPTQNCPTHTFVLGSWPWPRGLFTLSARLVDGAGAGQYRMPRGRVRSGLGRSTGWRGWSRRRGQGFGILADLARGVRGSGSARGQPPVSRNKSVDCSSTHRELSRADGLFRVSLALSPL